MRKKQKTAQVGSREYFDALLVYYSNRSTSLLRGRGNLSRDDLEYTVQAVAKLKDKRLQECIAELIAWGDEERSELETLIAIGFEAMKLCSPSRLREAAMRVSLKHYLHKEFSHASEEIARQSGSPSGVPGAEDAAGRPGQGAEVPGSTVSGGVQAPGHQ